MSDPRHTVRRAHEQTELSSNARAMAGDLLLKNTVEASFVAFWWKCDRDVGLVRELWTSLVA